MIKLIDYYDYYPILPDVDIPGLYWTNISYDDLSEEYKSEKAVYDRLVDFFKIPMLETETVSISVGKDIYGNISTTGSGNTYSDEANEISDYYSPQTVSTYNATVCYFSFSNRTYKGNAVDTSGIEGGYGIYKINYTQGKYISENGYFETGIDPSSLATCFPLDENYAVNEMWLSHDGLYLFCILLDTDDNAIFMQINAETMEAVSTISFQGDVLEYDITVYPYDDFSAVLANDAVTVFVPSDSGAYEKRFSVPISDYVSGGFKWLYESAVMDYNGERLAVVGNLPEQLYMTYQTCDFYIAVYGANGIEFYAEYKNSLSVNSYSGSYKANCHPEKLKVKWN